MYLALTGEGYTYRDLKDVADELKKQLVLVDGVRKIVIGGEQREVVYVEISRAKLGETGISMESIKQILASQNVVSEAGRVRVGDDYIRIEPTGEFISVKEIGDVLISSNDKKLLYLKDIANIVRAYEEVPGKMVYFNGKPALSIAISMRSGVNVVAVGGKLSQRFEELLELIPVGMDLNNIYNQPIEVDKSVSGFVVNVGQAILIVIVVLLFFMGLKVGLIIGSVLLITVAGTLLIMELYGIELQRVSLGALIIALGMLVDNAIVVAEGMLIKIQSGVKAGKAAAEVVGKNSWALLGGTVIGILAFSSIGLSESSTGEFASSLFYVLLISLSLSWVTAVSTTPLLCALFLKPKKGSQGEHEDPYGKGFFLLYRNFAKAAIKLRWLVVAIVIAMFVIAGVGFGYVKQAFFPNANTPMFFIDVWEPEGTDIRKTRDDTLHVAEFVRNQEGVDRTTSLIGGGDARFSLVYEPKENSPAYAQIIVQTETREQIQQVWDTTEKYMLDNMPQLDPILKPMRIGPGRDGKIEARFHGADPVVLRQLSEQAQAIMREDHEAKEVRDDWRQPVEKIQPVFNEQVARQLGINRQDLSAALASAFEGQQIGLYRDGIRLLPIKVRMPENERQDVANIQDIQVWSPVLQQAVPIAQVVNRFETVWENTVIRGRNRMQTIIASCNPNVELTDPLFNRLKPKIEAIPLPPGYTLSWGGEFEDSFEAQDALFAAIPVGFLMMILVSILLFGKIKQPLIIWLTVPLAIIGITAGLLGFNGAFDFMCLLGALSLIGLLIKNAIVLIEEIDQQIAEGKDPLTAILDSAVSRLRPVSMAASTTILGMIPLLQDVFFVNMSITIMAGLGFATVLTLVFVPVLYSILFKIPYAEDA
jgi:multidrug efflux pump subunit AcrB